MKKKMIWGLATLLLLLGIAAVFIFLDQNAELQQLEQETADSIKQLEERNNPQVVDVSDTQKPPPPDDGREYVWHGNHWDPVEALHAPIVEGSAPVKRVPSTPYQNNGKYIDVDYSFLDNPEEAIRRHAEIKLNPENYSRLEYDTVSQEASILIRKIADGYYGYGEYRDQLRKFRQEVYADPVLAKRGLSVDKLRKMVRGEIPPMIIPIDPIEFSDAVNGGESK